MTADQAIKILLSRKKCSETEVRQACLRGCIALAKLIELTPRRSKGDLVCDACGSSEYLFTLEGFRNLYCGLCGQKIDWESVSNMEDGT